MLSIQIQFDVNTYLNFPGENTHAEILWRIQIWRFVHQAVLDIKLPPQKIAKISSSKSLTLVIVRQKF